ncbi:hypothetical protein CLV90_1303 [Maribacter spongiicola]|uniref:Vitellogenin II n=1 Tax=Maribacter spongiicola TaxID=1206753 RepID=A0A4R7K825_9FLAO|nr:hypothetical protein [Maribacter spongiicola]TDT47230.1 hypothetical protein CLV90_1303 [Maribacter spongiicola]
MLVTLAVITASCGSYQQSSYYDNDGIYPDDASTTVERQPQQRNYTQNNPETDTYTNYFGEKANQYGEILDEEIFTDVDSYSSNDLNQDVQQDQLTDYYATANDYEGYGSWGSNNADVSIYIHNNGWNNWNNGGLYGWGWNNVGYAGFYGSGWGQPWGWNRWNRWNNWGYGGFGFGWNNWGYGGFGFGWNNWGNGWNNWGYGNGFNYGYGYGYGNRYYNRNNRFTNRSYAVNNSRRGNYTRTNSNNSGISSTAARGRSNVNTRGDSPRYRNSTARSTTARSSANTRSSRTYSGNSTTRRTIGVDQNRAYRTSRSTRAIPRYSSSSRNYSSRYSSSPRTYSSGTARSSSRVAVPRTSTYRNSGSSSRSYSSGRSSGSSSRSSNYNSGRSSSRSSNYSSGRSSSSGSSYRSSGSSSRSSSSGSSSRSSGSSSRSSSRGRN